MDRLRARLLILWETLQRLQPTSSAIVELGCFVGTSTLGFRMVMDELGFTYPKHVLHVYDSWQGLPDQGGGDRGAEKPSVAGG